MLRPFTLSGFWKPAPAPDEPQPPRRGPSRARIAAALRAFHDAGHRSVRILDLDCGNGERLAAAAADARALGFVAIEGRGASPSPADIRAARRTACLDPHPSTGLSFAIAEPMSLLASEHDGGADLVLLSDAAPYPVSPLGAAIERVCTGAVLGEG